MTGDALTIHDVAKRLVQSERVAVLTGAGISAESGVATFRDPDGLWSRFSPQELASMDGFLANPERVRDWYAYRRSVIDSVEPNAGHRSLAELERLVPHFTLATQNVDRLHLRAGSQNVLEVHGNLIENRCNTCDWIDDAHHERLECERCGGVMRPNVVWFGEMLPQEVFRAAEDAARSCDVFLTVGTSAEVYPAASLPYEARAHGAFVVEVNPSATPFTPHAHASLRGPSGVVLPAVLDAMGRNSKEAQV
jgi:NAD-dependent deacetylase